MVHVPCPWLVLEEDEMVDLKVPRQMCKSDPCLFIENDENGICVILAVGICEFHHEFHVHDIEFRMIMRFK